MTLVIRAACTNSDGSTKHTFSDRKAARRSARLRKLTAGHALRAYKCADCYGYHLTSSVRRAG